MLYDPSVILVVQHGEKVRSPGDPGLTELGTIQARETARLISSGPSPAAMIASPFKRAMETARPIAEACGLPLQVDGRLRERMNWSDDSAQDFEMFLAEWSQATHDRSFRPTTGDSSHDAAARFLEAIDDHQSKYLGETVVVVSHGGVTVDALRTIAGDDLIQAMSPTVIRDAIPCCGITRLKRAERTWNIETIGDTAHLESVEHNRPI